VVAEATAAASGIIRSSWVVVLLIYRNRHSIDLDRVDLMKG
jgi:NADH:ubiquinone oxidoreductase subunit K